MIKETVTYTDFNGNERTDSFYFNLTEAELVELEVGVEGGLKAILEKIIKEDDQRQIMEYFKKIVLMAYGEKSADGRYFEKSDKIRNGFAPTEAYSKIFMKMSTDAAAASKFIKGILPEKYSSQANVPNTPSETN